MAKFIYCRDERLGRNETPEKDRDKKIRRGKSTIDIVEMRDLIRLQLHELFNAHELKISSSLFSF